MEMTKELRIKLSENGYTVEENTMIKNGVEKVGYVIRKTNDDNKLCPMFYDFPQNVEEAFNYIVDCMIDNVSENDTKEIVSEEYAKNHIYLIALKGGKNDNLITRPTEFKGIEMGMAIDVNMGNVNGMVRITKDIASNYNDIDEMWEIAMKRTASDIKIDCFDDLGTMYVLSNNEMVQGASTIFTNRAKQLLKEKFIDRVNKLVLIPSSVHEWIVLPMLAMFENDTQTFVSMVKEMNETVVDETETLTNNAYIYDLEKGTITSIA